MKGLIFHQQQQQQQQHHHHQVLEENMSNLTSQSGTEASVSSGNIRGAETTNYQQYFATPPTQAQPPAKKKRNLPGNPDPDAEVIALSPKTLMATNRFVCEICNKGFQRDQNLQLHRRGHNLPWKLKQRTSKEIRKKVYVCPEPNCVHHDPSRALGDLTGIKKHFCRKHGEKKWKCDKCSKRYAVQSDWKAHSKTCGTREYRCDCGTLFSRRDSFITHRAFCDALADESARAITGTNPILSSSSHHQPGIVAGASSHVNLQIPQFNPQDFNAFSLKKEQQSYSLRQEMPPWLASQQPSILGSALPGLGQPPSSSHTVDRLSSPSSSIYNTRLHQDHQFTQTTHQDLTRNDHPANPNPSLGPTLSVPHTNYHQAMASAYPHMSATALLQKAAQMGATMSSGKASTATGNSSSSSSPAHHAALTRPHQQPPPPQQAHVSATAATPEHPAGNNKTKTTTGFGLNLSSREGVVHGLTPFGTKTSGGGSSGAFIQEMIMNTSFSSGYAAASPFDDALTFGGVFNSKKEHHLNHSFSESSSLSKTSRINDHGEELTRDFLGLRALSQTDILNMAGLGNCIDTRSSHDQQLNHSQKPWQG